MNYREVAHHYRQVFQYGFNAALLTELRDKAITFLRPAMARIPRDMSDKIRAAYKEKGISTKWNLTTTDAYSFCFMARHFKVGLTPSQLSAADLLYACTKALEENALSDRVRQDILDALGGLDSDTFHRGDGYSKDQAKKGKLRGEQQSREKAEKDEIEIIHGRGNVSVIINKLALMTDELGDWLNPREELWPNLFGDLDKLGLSPMEECDDHGTPLRIDYRDSAGKTGKIKFTSFKSMVSTTRGKVK
jgi:hypothetical protein